MNMETIAEKLLEKKEEIDKAKIEMAKIEGANKSLLEQLDKEFDCKTVEEGELKLDEIEKEIARMDKEIEEEYQKLDKKMNKMEEDDG